MQCTACRTSCRHFVRTLRTARASPLGIVAKLVSPSLRLTSIESAEAGGKIRACLPSAAVTVPNVDWRPRFVCRCPSAPDSTTPARRNPNFRISCRDSRTTRTHGSPSTCRACPRVLHAFSRRVRRPCLIACTRARPGAACRRSLHRGRHSTGQCPPPRPTSADGRGARARSSLAWTTWTAPRCFCSHPSRVSPRSESRSDTPLVLLGWLAVSFGSISSGHEVVPWLQSRPTIKPTPGICRGHLVQYALLCTVVATWTFEPCILTDEQLWTHIRCSNSVTRTPAVCRDSAFPICLLPARRTVWCTPLRDIESYACFLERCGFASPEVFQARSANQKNKKEPCEE